MGCGETLYQVGTRIACDNAECPRPTAAMDVLSDPDLIDHMVDLSELGFSLKHPLRERLDNELNRCGLHEWLQGCEVSPQPQGRYRVTWAEGNDEPTFIREELEEYSNAVSASAVGDGPPAAHARRDDVGDEGL